MAEEVIKKKRILAVIAGILVMLLLSGCAALMEQAEGDLAGTTGKERYEGFQDITGEYGVTDVVASGGIVCNGPRLSEGAKNWDIFVGKVEAKEPAFIRIMQKVNAKEAFYRDLIFDGSSFRLVISVNPEKYDYTYKYLLDLSGRKTKHSRKSRLVIVTNEKDALFEDVITSIGQNKENQKVDFQLVFRNQ